MIKDTPLIWQYINWEVSEYRRICGRFEYRINAMYNCELVEEVAAVHSTEISFRNISVILTYNSTFMILLTRDLVWIWATAESNCVFYTWMKKSYSDSLIPFKIIWRILMSRTVCQVVYCMIVHKPRALFICTFILSCSSQVWFTLLQIHFLICIQCMSSFSKHWYSTFRFYLFLLFPSISCFPKVINLFFFTQKMPYNPRKTKKVFTKPHFQKRENPRVFSLFCYVTLLSRTYWWAYSDKQWRLCDSLDFTK